MDNEEMKQKILDYCESKAKTKSKFYFNDFSKLLSDELKPRQVKKLMTELVQEGKLEFWSSGSTTMYGLAGAGKQHGEEGA